jgi:hypothetical protein
MEAEAHEMPSDETQSGTKVEPARNHLPGNVCNPVSDQQERVSAPHPCRHGNDTRERTDLRRIKARLDHGTGTWPRDGACHIQAMSR